MKKLLFILPFLALVAICSCNKQKPETHENAILCDTLHVDTTDSAYEVGPYEAYMDSLKYLSHLGIVLTSNISKVSF